MRFKILKSFKFAHRGVEVIEYAEGDEVDVDDTDFEQVAISEGWAEIAGGEKQPPDPNQNPDPEPTGEGGEDQLPDAPAADEGAPEKSKPTRKKSED